MVIVMIIGALLTLFYGNMVLSTLALVGTVLTMLGGNVLLCILVIIGAVAMFGGNILLLILVIIGTVYSMFPQMFLYAIGFGKAGVISGSIAATVQSWIGSVKAESAFAAMQSAGTEEVSYTNALLKVVVEVAEFLFGNGTQT